jgi:metal-responsive CopG/Arc/MetJ family transcriptional regulator
MKTAVSVPNDVYEKAERLAKREGRSRSEVYSAALREYVARHSPDELTASIDAALADVGDSATLDGFVRVASAATLGSTEW